MGSTKNAVVIGRFALVTAAIALCSLAFGVAGSAAKTKKAKPVVTKVHCTSLLSDAVPVGSTLITPPLDSGAQFGTASCGAWGKGAVTDSFSTDDGGDISGPMTTYLKSGGVSTKYTLTQSANQPLPTPYTFGNADYVGTVKVTGGFGAFAKAKGTGTIACDTLDSVHFSCTEHLKLKLPAA
jgi:hypothetical protein